MLLVFVAAGCASPKGRFVAKKDPSYHGKMGRILVVYNNASTASVLGRGFSEQLAERLRALLALKGVPSQPVRLEQEALDRNAPLRAAVVQFRPSHLLSFAITRVNTSSSVHRAFPGQLAQFNSETSVTLEFTVVETQSGRTVWRAESSFDAAPSPPDVAEQLIGELAGAQFFY